MPVVVSAARQVIDVCQELFADRRWNCSSILLSPNYLADLTGGTVYLPMHLYFAGNRQYVTVKCQYQSQSKCIWRDKGCMPQFDASVPSSSIA